MDAVVMPRSGLTNNSLDLAAIISRKDPFNKHKTHKPEISQQQYTVVIQFVHVCMLGTQFIHPHLCRSAAMLTPSALLAA